MCMNSLLVRTPQSHRSSSNGIAPQFLCKPYLHTVLPDPEQHLALCRTPCWNPVATTQMWLTRHLRRLCGQEGGVGHEEEQSRLQQRVVPDVRELSQLHVQLRLHLFCIVHVCSSFKQECLQHWTHAMQCSACLRVCVCVRVRVGTQDSNLWVVFARATLASREHAASFLVLSLEFSVHSVTYENENLSFVRT